MQRRSFITLLGGAAAAWPLAARAQQDGRIRRIGWLTSNPENIAAPSSNFIAFREALAKLGWIEGRNLRIELRATAAVPELIRAYAAELVGLACEAIVVTNTAAARALLQQTQTIPIIFAGIADPVASGLVRSIARPDGNATGFSWSETSLGTKWLELIKEAAPNVKRVGLPFKPDTSSGAWIPPIEAAAASLAVTTTRLPVRTASDIEPAFKAFAAESGGGLIVVPDSSNSLYRETIYRLAIQYRLPAVYPFRSWAAEGGLIVYGVDSFDINRRAASYVDRLLRGANVSELPVQFPTKYELIINLKTAKTMGLTMPEAFLLRADELIE